MRFFFALLLTVIIFFESNAQGSGKALDFDASDYVSLGSSFGNLSFPISFTYWINKKTNNTIRVFSSSYISTGYAGVRSTIINSGTVQGLIGDGTGFSPADRKSIYTTNSQATYNWIHVAIVFTNYNTKTIYINGVAVSTYLIGSGGVISQPANASGHFGRCWTGQGWKYMVAELDDFTIWNKALTANEVRDMVCRKTNPNASQLLGYFDFDNPTATTVTDLANGYVGTFNGNIGTPTSGASIGDTSYHAYPAPGGGFNQTLSDGEQISVTNYPASTEGVQVYEVMSAPNSTTGLPTGLNPSQYFGVFLATENYNKTYTLEVPNFSAAVQVYQRDANDDNTWAQLTPNSMSGTTALFNSTSHTSEYIIKRQKDCRVNLGADINTCMPVNVWLKDLHFDAAKSYTWNTGSTADSILITAPGKYYVEMDSAGCIQHDTIEVFAKEVKIDLGPNLNLCDGESVWLKDAFFSTSKIYSWNGTSVADSLQVTTSQTVFVEVDSAGCLGWDTVTINIDTYPPPVFDTIKKKCIEEPETYGFPEGDYTFLWPTGSTFNYFKVTTQTEVPFYTISPCGDSTLHTLHIEQVVCDNPCHVWVPNVFTPNDDFKNDRFKVGAECDFTSFSFQIFNRWGNIVYHTENPDFEWDGTFDGEPLAEGVYTYIMKYSGFDQERKTKNGLIHLMR